MSGRRRKPGRMGPFIEGYRAWLAGRGYAPGTIAGMLAMAGGLGRWMDARGLAPGDLDRAAVTEFRDALRAAGRRWVPGVYGLDRLLEYLEGLGVLVHQHAATAALRCPSIRPDKLHPHILRHSCAMTLLHAGVDTAIIELWLGHADIRSTNTYLHADMAIKQRALDLTTPTSAPPGRYRPADPLLAVLESL